MTPRLSHATLLFASLAAVVVGLSCTENLPSGPETFAAVLKMVVAHDTIVIGDSSVAQARATDAAGNVIQGLSFNWSSADTNVLPFAANVGAEAQAGRTHTLVGRRTGLSAVTITLPDPRFVVQSTSRTETVVVGGVKVLTSKDTTLTSIKDTARAIAAGLVRVNGALVTRASQGIRWLHLGTRTTVVGQGDTIRFIAVANGVDTLIALHDLCLAGAKCADTVFARVSQKLALSLSARSFNVFSFSDTTGPTATLADARGTGQFGTSVRLVPRTAGDSALVLVTAPVGTSNFTTGVLATPRLVSKGNGTARVLVLGIGTDGSVVATDSITLTVRQVARRVAIEPLRALVSSSDSIPIRPIARDARGFTIADATIAANPGGVTLNGIWAGPTAIAGAAAIGTITPVLVGVALPSNNPQAPQVAPAVDVASITILKTDTVVAGSTERISTVTVFDSNAAVAVGSTILVQGPGVRPNSVITDANGNATVDWIPPDLVGRYTLTAVRQVPTLATLSDSAGRIVIRRSVVVTPDVSSALTSSVSITALTVAVNQTLTLTIVLRDRFGNVITAPVGNEFTLAATVGGGTFGAVTCGVNGVCTVVYTAPAAAGTDTISVQILGVDILNSPIQVTITP